MALACAQQSVPKDTGPVESSAVSTKAKVEFSLESPVADSTIKVDWVPLLARMPLSWEDRTVEMWVNGKNLTDPMARSRSRWSKEGGGLDYLAMLSTDRLANGDHVIRLVAKDADGTEDVVSHTIRVKRPKSGARIRVVNGKGDLIAARVAVLVKGKTGDWRPHRLVGPNAGKADPLSRDTRWHSVMVMGEGTVSLPSGQYKFLAVRDMESTLGVAEFELDQNEQANVELVVEHVLAMDEWLSADLHVHTGNSGDAFVPDLLRLQSLAASGLEVGVISDHNRITDLQRLRSGLTALSQRFGGTTSLVAGLEARIGPKGKSIGHFNVYPVADDGSQLPPPKSRNFAKHVDAYRTRQREVPHPATGDQVIVQLNHPRGLQMFPRVAVNWKGHALWNNVGFDRKVALGEGANAWLTEPFGAEGLTALDFDVLEVVNRFSWPLYQEVRKDWFLLMNLGHRMTGAGNSDSHALAVELVGFPRNYVADDKVRVQGGIDTAAFIRTVQAGRMTISTGPIVDLVVRGANGEAGPGQELAVNPDGTVAVDVTVRAAPWVPVAEVRLVVDGQVAHKRVLADVDGPRPLLRSKDQWTVSVAPGSWILAEAGWPIEESVPEDRSVLGEYNAALPGYLPLAFTNPVWVR